LISFIHEFIHEKHETAWVLGYSVIPRLFESRVAHEEKKRQKWRFFFILRAFWGVENDVLVM